MKQDYWFERGDKVMRVAYADQLGLSFQVNTRPETDFGIVLCVEKCWQGVDGMNRVTFIGVQMWGQCYASCFRKIEEIKLCVKAAQKVGESLEIEPELSGP